MIQICRKNAESVDFCFTWSAQWALGGAESGRAIIGWGGAGGSRGPQLTLELENRERGETELGVGEQFGG